MKIPAREFNNKGQYPIIDQSQNSISGWTDDKTALVNGRGGLVIFGDHTCTVKFVNEQFAQGADGIKILSIKDRLDPRFTYFYLLSHPIEKDGYRRHFSKLKEMPIAVPSTETQHAVVEQLDIEHSLVLANRELIDRFEDKIEAVIARVWGDVASRIGA